MAPNNPCGVQFKAADVSVHPSTAARMTKIISRLEAIRRNLEKLTEEAETLQQEAYDLASTTAEALAAAEVAEIQRFVREEPEHALASVNDYLTEFAPAASYVSSVDEIDDEHEHFVHHEGRKLHHLRDLWDSDINDNLHQLDWSPSSLFEALDAAIDALRELPFSTATLADPGISYCPNPKCACRRTGRNRR